jgi:succinylglutamate desuccinylase
MSTEKVLYTPGQRVRVIQQVARQRDAFTTSIEGTVVKFEQQKTGSWYAHAQDNKLWLDRLELRKDDGETVILNLDRNSRVEAVR